MEKINVSRFKATCLELLQRVRRTGQSIIITRHGEPIAQVGPVSMASQSESWLGSARGTGEILGDIIAPVADQGWEALED